MHIRYANDTAYVTGTPFDLNLTLMHSAQTFHWIEANGAHYAMVDQQPVRVRAEADGFSIYPCSPGRMEGLLRYFDLSRDYAAVYERYAEYDTARRAFLALRGLRVLNQEPWPTLLMFILSANNNAARIRTLTMALCARFGIMDELDDEVLYDFPPCEALADVREEDLRAIGCGYRARYLVGAARMVRDGFPLDELSSLPYPEAHRMLKRLPGVGDKVADCVLLLGCGHSSAFPVDVWVERLMRAWFPELAKENMSRARISALAREAFGEDAGILQTYLFHSARKGVLGPFDLSD